MISGGDALSSLKSVYDEWLVMKTEFRHLLREVEKLDKQFNEVVVGLTSKKGEFRDELRARIRVLEDSEREKRQDVEGRLLRLEVRFEAVIENSVKSAAEQVMREHVERHGELPMGNRKRLDGPFAPPADLPALGNPDPTDTEPA